MIHKDGKSNSIWHPGSIARRVQRMKMLRAKKWLISQSCICDPGPPEAVAAAAGRHGEKRVQREENPISL